MDAPESCYGSPYTSALQFLDPLVPIDLLRFSSNSMGVGGQRFLDHSQGALRYLFKVALGLYIFDNSIQDPPRSVAQIPLAFLLWWGVDYLREPKEDA